MARGVEESNAGVRTKYLLEGGLLQHACSSGLDDDGTVHLLDAEAYCERFSSWSTLSWPARIKRCRLALANMRRAGGGRHADALHVVYGHPDPLLRQLPGGALDALGDAAPLARYTDAVEERRRRMVRAELGAGALTRVNASGLAELGVVDLALARDRERWVDRMVSSADALREALAPFHSRRHEGEDKAAWQARRDAHGWRRADFLAAVGRDAGRMLEEAGRAYAEAWRASK